MPLDRMATLLRGELDTLARDGRSKRGETVITGLVPARGDSGPRFRVAGEGDKNFIRMNANNYLGLSLRQALIEAEHAGVDRYGTGPGAVRFISGTWASHLALEARLAAFHRRAAAMVFSSAYAAMLGVLPPLITADTAVISDALNHNCIINAIRLARPRERHVYRHLDLGELDAALRQAAGACRRAIVVTDGIFSMRGDHAPLAEIAALVRQHDAAFAENVLLVVDDSHGVGCFGATGRGTEERESVAADILVATLGKAFGVNGGYVVADPTVIDFLRETSPLYVYSNSIAPGEAAAAAHAVDLVDGPLGRELLAHLRAMSARFRAGLQRLGLETIAAEHPIVPLLTRDSRRTTALVAHLRRHGVLATGISFPVVPRGDEEIRFQVSADLTPSDIDAVLEIIAGFAESA